jgi:hypothetical protein
MVEVNWVRVTDISFYIQAGDIVESDSEWPYRVYRPKGRKYPLLVIEMAPDLRVYDGHPPSGVRICVSYKTRKGEWWTGSVPQAFIPVELFGDLTEMLEEAAKMIRKQRRMGK